MASVGQQVIERLVAKLGGVEQAAAHLGVTLTLVQRFLNGSLLVPDQLLLRAIDLGFDGVPIKPPAVPSQSPPPKVQTKN